MVVDPRPRVLQLVLFTLTNDYAEEILARMQTAYAFHSALVKPDEDFDATLKRCADHVHFAVLLPVLSFEVPDGTNTDGVLRDATLAISTLRRGASQVGSITKLVWMRLALHIGEAIETVTTAMVEVIVRRRSLRRAPSPEQRPGHLQRRVPLDSTEQRCN